MTRRSVRAVYDADARDDAGQVVGVLGTSHARTVELIKRADIARKAPTPEVAAVAD